MEQSHSWEADGRSAGQKFPVSYGNRRFITVFTRARHWSLSRSAWIQSTPSCPVSKMQFNIVLPHMPLSPKWPLSFRFSEQDFYAFHISMLATCPTNRIPPPQIWTGEWSGPWTCVLRPAVQGVRVESASCSQTVDEEGWRPKSKNKTVYFDGQTFAWWWFLELTCHS